MNQTKEITVKVNLTKQELIDLLINEQYKKIDKYIMNDIYFVKKDTDLSQNSLNLFKNYILIRDLNELTFPEQNKIQYTHKTKEYDDKENIISESKTSVEIKNKEEGIKFLNSLNYQELIKITDLIEVYQKDNFKICLQYVNDKYLFIEIESNDKYPTIDSLIEELDKTNIPYDKSNYFVKKAQIIFEEQYKKN